MTKLFSCILAFIISISLVGCGLPSKAIQAKAQVISDAFTDGNMETITKTILGTSSHSAEDSFSEAEAEDAHSQGSVLTCIFDLVTVDVKEITDHTIAYEIGAPDMSKVFVDLTADADNLSEDELFNYIQNYAKTAPIERTTVSIAYSFVGNEPVLDYQDEAFLNAVTGGLLDAYRVLYVEMLEAYYAQNVGSASDSPTLNQQDESQPDENAGQAKSWKLLDLYKVLISEMQEEPTKGANAP